MGNFSAIKFSIRCYYCDNIIMIVIIKCDSPNFLSSLILLSWDSWVKVNASGRTIFVSRWISRTFNRPSTLEIAIGRQTLRPLIVESGPSIPWCVCFASKRQISVTFLLINLCRPLLLASRPCTSFRGRNVS